jgi:WASH complex subunit 7
MLFVFYSSLFFRPALCMNYVRYIGLAKDKLLLQSKRQVSGVFTEDGFALGVAYILAVLRQESRFKSLHWFDSVNMKLKADKESLDIQKAERKKSEEDLQSLQASIAKIVNQQME